MQTARNALVNNAQKELYNTLRYHMVNKRFLTKDLKNDMTLQSTYNKQGLHINHYSNGVRIKINTMQRAQYVVVLFVERVETNLKRNQLFHNEYYFISYEN